MEYRVKTGPKPLPLAVRFERHVHRRGECHLWTGAVDPAGYGKIGLGGHKGRTVRASRVAWELANGPVPLGMFVLHHCDNRRCVNAGHLFLGTHQDNMADMVAKGRQSKIVRHRGGKHRSGCDRRPRCDCYAKPDSRRSMQMVRANGWGAWSVA